MKDRHYSDIKNSHTNKILIQLKFTPRLGPALAVEDCLNRPV